MEYIDIAKIVDFWWLCFEVFLAKLSYSLLFLLLFSVTGPVTYRSEDNRTRFVLDIDRLVARGGGDCSELAITGMLDAIDRGPKYGSPLFMFTDASAKDAYTSNIASLKSAAELNDVTITFFSNLGGCGDGGIDYYKEIALHTGGKTTLLLKWVPMFINF